MSFLTTLFIVTFADNESGHEVKEEWSGEDISGYLDDQQLEELNRLPVGHKMEIESVKETVTILKTNQVYIEQAPISPLNPFEQWDNGEWVSEFDETDYLD